MTAARCSDTLFASASFAAHALNPLEIAPRNSELGVRFFPFGVVIPTFPFLRCAPGEPDMERIEGMRWRIANFIDVAKTGPFNGPHRQSRPPYRRVCNPATPSFALPTWVANAPPPQNET